jgi:hypothetical protein
MGKEKQPQKNNLPQWVSEALASDKPQAEAKASAKPSEAKPQPQPSVNPKAGYIPDEAGHGPYKITFYRSADAKVRDFVAFVSSWSADPAEVARIIKEEPEHVLCSHDLGQKPGRWSTIAFEYYSEALCGLILEYTVLFPAGYVAVLGRAVFDKPAMSKAKASGSSKIVWE